MTQKSILNNHFNIYIKYLLTIFCVFFFAFAEAQTIKVDMDSVIVYCKYNDLMRSIKQVGHYSSSTVWIPKKGIFGVYKKKIVDRSPPYYIDSLKILKKISGDTIILSEELWSIEMYDETSRLAKKRKLIFFDKRNNKKVIHVKRIVKGKKGQILFYVFIDNATGNELYRTVKMDWAKF